MTKNQQKPRNIVAIIPARGGSKALPRKNVLPLLGKPLIAWTIEAALRSTFITRIIVSTDDPEIAQISRQYGAEVIDRPLELATDQATSESALLHAIEVLENKEKYSPFLTVFLQCTSPLTTENDIDKAVKWLLAKDADSCFTACNFHYFVWRETQNFTAVGVNHDKSYRPRRQDIDPQYQENGAVYVMKTGGFKKAKHRFFGKTVMSHMPAKRCIEIDEPVDLKIAEMLLQEQEQKKTMDRLPKGVNALILDFDGVLSDNRVVVDQNGRESVLCDRSDGWGLSQLQEAGVRVAVLSTEENPVVSARCNKLGIECQQGLGRKKLDAFLRWCERKQTSPERVVFIGNDVNDVECLKISGCSVAPADAHPDAKKWATIVLKRKGGRGAVRELCDLFLNTLENERE